MLKKHGPGCRCCARGMGIGSYQVNPFGNGNHCSADAALFSLNSDPPPLMRFPGIGAANRRIWSNLTGIGAGAYAIGEDVERRRFLVRRANNEIWTVAIDGTTERLWTASANAATLQVKWIRYHHSWGVACWHYIDEYDTAEADTSLWKFGSLNSGGNHLQGPFNLTDSIHLVPDLGGGGGFGATAGNSNRHFCVDPDGNVYHLRQYRAGVFAGGGTPPPPLSTLLLTKNNASYGLGAGSRNFGTQFGSPVTGQHAGPIFHDGVYLHTCVRDIPEQSADYPAAIYRVQTSGYAQHVLDLEDVLGFALPSGSILSLLTSLAFDGLHSLVTATVYDPSFDRHLANYFSVDGQHVHNAIAIPQSYPGAFGSVNGEPEFICDVR